jgi:hypothetical protein
MHAVGSLTVNRKTTEGNFVVLDARPRKTFLLPPGMVLIDREGQKYGAKGSEIFGDRVEIRYVKRL